MSYVHTQRVPTPVLVGLGVLGVATLVVVPLRLLRAVIIASLAGAGYTFQSMTVTVDEAEIQVLFGGWLNAKTIAMDDVAECTIVRMSPISGWGIHWTGDGWLYNIFGLNAVELVMKDGTKTFIGTDEPGELSAAVRQHLHLHSTT